MKHKNNLLGKGDGRTRIHIWPHARGAAWSIGPVGLRTPRSSPGDALDNAIAASSADPAAGLVVILETAETYRG